MKTAGGCIYFHIPDEEKRRRVKALCDGKGIQTAEITGADVNRTVLELISGKTGAGQKNPAPVQKNAAGEDGAGKNGAGKYAPPLYFLPELLLFQGLPTRELYRFLEDLKAAGIPRIDLKAAVTPYNLNWTLYELAENLKEEHAAMGG